MFAFASSTSIPAPFSNTLSDTHTTRGHQRPPASNGDPSQSVSPVLPSLDPDPDPEPNTPAPPSVSEVTLVEVTLLGDLVRILRESAAHQRALVEQQTLANAHRAALTDAHRASAAHHAALAEQLRISNAAAIRSELRAYNSSASHWKPLPLMNGDPFPSANVRFPQNIWALRQLQEADVRRLAEAYEIYNPSADVQNLQNDLALFITGRP